MDFAKIIALVVLFLETSIEANRSLIAMRADAGKFVAETTTPPAAGGSKKGGKKTPAATPTPEETSGGAAAANDELDDFDTLSGDAEPEKTYTKAEVRAALVTYRDANGGKTGGGNTKVAAAIKSVGGVKFEDVPEDKYGELMTIIQG